jgi:uncharacterized membrane-anchored protein YjiN (DUF445 family)
LEQTLALVTSHRFEAGAKDLARTLLASGTVEAWVDARVNDARARLGEQLSDAASPLRRQLRARLVELAATVQRDEALRDRLETSALALVRLAAARFHDEVAALVSRTIQDWDARETAARLQLLLGPDLQWVRINGTLIGGLAGLLIHAVAQVLR